MVNKELWDKTVEFHGHECPGLTMGYRAALYAIKLLDLKFSEDEQIVCVSENDACGVDAIQVILGCSVGKGNLLFNVVGKQAFSFYNRTTGKSVRLVVKQKPGMSREESFKYYHECSDEEMFDVKETTIEIPERAKLFNSYVCDVCGETTAENWIRLRDGKKVCLDCYDTYDRFHIKLR